MYLGYCEMGMLFLYWNNGDISSCYGSFLSLNLPTGVLKEHMERVHMVCNGSGLILAIVAIPYTGDYYAHNTTGRIDCVSVP